MEKDLGSIIKLKRIQKEMTQEELCYGICTPSYLSRIENNHVHPDKSIINLLFSRLAISLTNKDWTKSDINKRIEIWYKSMIERKNHQENVYELMQLAEVTNNESMIKYNIVYSRYLLEIGDLNKAGEILHSVGNIIKPEYSRNYFLYTSIIMGYYHLKEDYDSALKKGLILTKIQNYDDLGSKLEVGILYYNLALNYSKVYQNERCIHYCNIALAIFNNNYFFDRAIDCHLLLGISYNRLGFWTKSIHSYHLTEKLISFLPNQDQFRYKGMIYNNIGYCFENQGKYNDAIVYYKKSLELKKNPSHKLRTFINLIRSTNALGDKKAAENWLRLGLDTVDKSSPLRYHYQLQIYKLLLQSKEVDFQDITTIQTDSIQYFLNNHMWKLVYEYTKVFAHLYEEHSHYKKANSMYKLALEASTKLFIRKGGENHEKSNFSNLPYNLDIESILQHDKLPR
ncbi:tetratricopeptide repeat protein [Aquibacillus sp. 3ASR75-11]|uniref:Tetratricopeptide repeat protein n=1 Tax=Terrihalobacillus insolitus TaxID=2950438 RepID=A0A9X3WPA8_9BACI|nr:helix-turn-helix domain-containing protein [Terrihalobacillus insolitus]MDC3411979.1 tetratricopeptide repeat protein [Terrihalobacillus insolitus]MDC3423335.1 tetratricopeptide repeat protein [Terrihalobacillus insolitus]